MKLPKFRTGNVILSPFKTVEIVTDCNDKYVNYVSAQYSNVSGGGLLEQTCTVVECDCDPMRGFDVIREPEYDPDCFKCKGSGQYEKIVPGWNESIILADSVQEYITKKIMKNLFPELS